MNCNELSGLVSEYVDGNLADSVKRRFESHLDRCEACASKVRAMKAMVASLCALGGHRSPVDSWVAIQARVSLVERARAAWWRWVLRPIVAAPAAAAAAIIVFFLVWPAVNSVPMASDKAFAPEYSYYIGAHSHLQRRQAFVDPDMVFVKAELQKASLVSNAEE